MILHSATISGFKSFRRPVQIFFSPRTTVLVGPNDHGKTNVLLAIDRLGADKAFPVEDVNDRVRGEKTAHITYQFQVSEAEIRAIEAGIQPLLEQENESERERLSKFSTVDQPDSAEISRKDEAQSLSSLSAHGSGPLKEWWTNTQDSKHIEFTRLVGKPLDLKNEALADATRLALVALLLPLMPKVFLFTPTALRQLPDTVNLSTLEANEVMQGVFRLAGIWELRQTLLSGNTRQNQDDLREASATLTRQIRKNSTQGKDLEFYMEYVGNDIRLTVKDTARTVTAIADRSDGFTAYFAMRMLLVARTDQATPNGYVFMFDEPGLNLHPKGQVDLQNVFEDIARTNQIIYSTHSVFLINKNYPERNHLIYKNENGSNIDNKPFIGGWAKVREHLGLYLSANFLFADKILLAEGPTDEIYLPLILQGLIERGRFSGDLNGFAMRSSLNSKEMLALASMYTQEQRFVAALVDGDTEGQQRKGKIDAWVQRAKRECPVIILSEFKEAPCSIEDFLEATTYRTAILSACKQAVDAGHLQTQKDAWPAELKRLLDTPDGKDGTDRKSLGKRVEAATKEIFGESISDNNIAIKYSELLQAGSEPDNADDAIPSIEQYWEDETLQKLANALWKALKLPMRGDITGIPFAG